MKSLERQRYFIDFTLSSLLRRKWKNISLVIVYALIVFMLASVLFFTGAVHKEAASVLAGSPEIIVQRTVAGRHELIPAVYAETIKSIHGVRKVEGRLWGYYYHQASRANYTVMSIEGYSLKDDQVAIGEGVRRTWKGVLNNKLYFRAYDGVAITLDIADEFTGDTALVSSDLVLMTEKNFRRIFGVDQGYFTDLVATVRNLNECPTIAEKITVQLPDSRPILREEILRTYSSLFDWRSGYVIVLLAGAVLSFLIFAWDKATGLTAEERSEIGILKAVGWDTGDVLLLKFWEGMVVCLTAFVVGAAAAYVHVFMTDAPLFEHALKGWAVLYPSFELTPAFDAYQLAAVFGLTVVPYTLITIVPAWRVAVTDPDAVMR